jgi:hypothetical protein
VYIHAQVLDKVVDQLIQIDVEIVVMDEPEDGEGGMFDMELDSERSVARRENEERAEKLDAMMLITFEFLKGVYASCLLNVEINQCEVRCASACLLVL